ncbi:S-layer homology domain-containing protein [Salibacterium qingdaonense]|uniref:S-layer homology domain-containing protein n=1 Tax=Salibacterium qingdaonense TaxID=266892 RepID=A0A1I4L2Y0_9BACI|nr:S-layer homology domain-containing protein [Salibacterium qingdaonense]SFL85163.1 S-layer homology domain-containing protein [Salibacterium qingdaonense]
MKKFITGLALAGSITAAGTAGAAEEEGSGSDEQALSFKEKKELLTEAALEHDIPPEIVKAIAYEETAMRQFDENGNPVMNQNEDGGVGIMQVTLDENDLEDRSVDQGRLEQDTAYNIEVGVDLLNEKWNWTGSVLPTVNDGNKQVLENWYFAILAYNGLDRRNDPTEAEEVYQEDVYGVIENNSLLGSSQVDFPEWNAVYQDGEDRIRFEEQEVETDTKTPSTQMAQNGDNIYAYGEDPGTQVNFREGPSTTSRTVGDISLYTPLEVEGAAAHDNSPTNHFVYYPVYYADIHGYMASAYARRGDVTNFYDVRGQELTEAVGYLEVRGILSGYPGGEFRPNESILRRHAASMMVDALNLEAPGDYELQAADMKAGDRGYDAMRILEYHGIMTGSDGNIRPNENMTRAQTASILVSGFEETLEAPVDSHSFEDIGEDFWNYEAINTLYHNEVTTVEAFRPNEDLKRSQFALFLKAAMRN